MCPFHVGSSNPHLSVNAGLFNCFVCHKGGDLFRFVQLMDGVEFRESLDILAGLLGITYRPILRTQQQWEVGLQLDDVIATAALAYHEGLTPDARTYLTDVRGLPAPLLGTHLLGYADGSFPERLLRARGDSWAPLLEASGLLTKRGSDRFAGRVIFPSLVRGQATFLTGRSLAGEEPRFMHLSGRKAPLYNQQALAADEVFITEGPIDCLSLVAWGYSAVALHGGAREVPIAQFRRPKMRYLCLDSDDAGRASIVRFARLFAASALPVKVIEFPDGMDPNDFYRQHTVAEFAELKTAAQDPLLYLLARLAPETVDLQDFTPLFQILSSYTPVQAVMTMTRVVAPHFGWSAKTAKAMTNYIWRYGES